LGRGYAAAPITDWFNPSTAHFGPSLVTARIRGLAGFAVCPPCAARISKPRRVPRRGQRRRRRRPIPSHQAARFRRSWGSSGPRLCGHGGPSRRRPPGLVQR